MDITDEEKTRNDTISSSGLLYQFPASLTCFFIILYVVTSIVAVTGNCLVIYVVLRKRLKTVTNLFIANLALADVIIGTFAIPFQFQAILLQRWDLPPAMCKAILRAWYIFYCNPALVLSLHLRGVCQCLGVDAGADQYGPVPRHHPPPLPQTQVRITHYTLSLEGEVWPTKF